MEKRKVRLPDGNEMVMVILTTTEYIGYVQKFAVAMGVDPKALLNVPALPIARDERIPEEVDPFRIFEVEEDKLLLVVDTMVSEVMQSMQLFDLATAVGMQCVKEGGKLPKLMLFADVYDDYKPKLSGSPKCYITRVQVFLVEGKGYYGQVYITTLQKEGGMLHPVEWMHPCKIDPENRQFILIERKEGEERGFRIQDRLKNIENLDKIVDLVIQRIVEEPEVKLDPEAVEVDPQEIDSDEWWRGKAGDSDWWKKGKKPDEDDADV